MKKVDFENALMSTIVDYVSDQIILRYMDACKKATVLFTGALIGYTDAVVSLNELKENGWELTAVLSKAAAEVITEERIRKDIDPKSIIVEGAPVNGRQIINDSQFVIIPTLTINTTSKLANCIFDNLVTNMISYALHTGKPVVAALDGCCPDNKVREQIGFKVTEAYKAKLRSNLADLQTYGITLTTDKNLSNKVQKVFSAGFDFAVPEGQADSKLEGLPINPEALIGQMSASVVSSIGENAMAKLVSTKEKEDAPASLYLDKNVIGRTDIAKNARYKTIEVSADALVTGLAADEARNRGITIVRK